METDESGMGGRVTTAQAAAILAKRLGRSVKLEPLERTLRSLVNMGVLRKAEGERWLLTAQDVDIAEGELYRRHAPWYRSWAVKQGFPAWIEGDGWERVLLVPHSLHAVTGRTAREGTPERIPIVAWPTAETVGELRLDGERDGLPRYVVAGPRVRTRA
jgi:hypothetical protein